MDGSAQNEVAQGNSMLSDMREHNREVLRHNLATQTNFNTQIITAQRTAREAASDKKAETAGEGLGEGGAQALKLAKTGYEAYGKVASGIGFQGMGRAEVAGRTAIQVFKDAPIGQAVSKTAGAAKDVAEAAKPLVEAAAPVVKSGLEAVGSTPSAMARSGFLGGAAQQSQRLADVEQSTARTMGTADQPADDAVEAAHAEITAPKVGTIAGPKTAALTDAPEARLTAAGKSITADAPALESAGAKVGGMGGKLAAGLDLAEKGGALLSVATGGLDAIEDAVSGHIMGHNTDSKAGNELGIAGGVASLAGFMIPGMGLIGAGLGIAAGVESMIGSEKHSEKEITTTLPTQEKEEEETTVKYAGPTAGSTGQVTQEQTSALAKTGGAASAF